MENRELYTETFYKGGKEVSVKYGLGMSIGGADSIQKIAEWLVTQDIPCHDIGQGKWVPLNIGNLGNPVLDIHKTVCGDGTVTVSLKRGFNEGQLEELAKAVSDIASRKLSILG